MLPNICLWVVKLFGGSRFSFSFNHAFFEASLFLGAGSVMHAAGDEQGLGDMVKCGWMVVVMGAAAMNERWYRVLCCSDACGLWGGVDDE